MNSVIQALRNTFLPLSSVIVAGRKVVTTSGTRVQVTTVKTPCRGVWLSADENNTGAIVVGNNLVVGTAGSQLGASTAGGGFGSDVPSAGTDFSNQDSAQESYTTLATVDGTTTTVTCSGADTFNANIIGNVIQIASGTNFNAGFYQVLTRTSSTEITLDRSPASAAGSSGVGAMGGAIDILLDSFFDGAEKGVIAGNTIYIKNDGDMSTGTISVALDGTLLLFITIEGYNTTRGDNPVGANRPAIVAGSSAFNFDNFWVIKNIIFTSTGSAGIDVDSQVQMINIKSTNSSTIANRNAFTPGIGAVVINCEAISTEGEGFVTSGNASILYSYIHDCNIGINPNDSVTVVGNVFDTCVSGVKEAGVGQDNVKIINNTFYNNTTAIDSAATNDGWIIVNNIFDANINGLVWGDADKTRFVDFNLWDNTTDVDSNSSKGPNAVTSDPSLTVALVSGSDGTTEAGDETDFRAASAPFGSVDTNDVLIIHSGTSVTTGVFTISSVVSTSQLTISAGATVSASSVVYGVAKGEDFTLGSSSTALDAGLQVGTDQGVTGDYEWNIGADQDDVAGGAAATTAFTFS